MLGFCSNLKVNDRSGYIDHDQKDHCLCSLIYCTEISHEFGALECNNDYIVRSYKFFSVLITFVCAK